MQPAGKALKQWGESVSKPDPGVNMHKFHERTQHLHQDFKWAKRIEKSATGVLAPSRDLLRTSSSRIEPEQGKGREMSGLIRTPVARKRVLLTPPTSPPVLEAWMIIVLPTTGPEVKLQIRAEARSVFDRERARGERVLFYVRQLVARAAPIRLGLARKVDSGETVSKGIGNDDRRVVCAGESGTAVATGRGVDIAQGVVGLVAGRDCVGDSGLAVPGARSLAAIL